MIESAVPELLDLAEAMRGREWRDRLQQSIAAAQTDGWTWLEVFSVTTGLMRRADAEPQELVAAVRRRLPATGPPADQHEAADRARALLGYPKPGDDDSAIGSVPLDDAERAVPPPGPERDAQAAALRREGVTFGQVAERLGFESMRDAWEAVQRHQHREPPADDDLGDEANEYAHGDPGDVLNGYTGQPY